MRFCDFSLFLVITRFSIKAGLWLGLCPLFKRAYSGLAAFSHYKLLFIDF